MYNFQYHRPKNLEEASQTLDVGDDPKLVAGGMTIIPTLKQRLAQPSDLIDLADINNLVGISLQDQPLEIASLIIGLQNILQTMRGNLVTIV